MPTKATEVDTLSSYAHRMGGDVHLVLELPETSPADGPARLVLRREAGRGRAGRGGRGDKVVRVDAETAPAGAGVRLEARVPARRLPPGLWRLALRRDESATPERLQARLLTSRTQPVALLAGPRPSMKMAPPRPRTPSGPAAVAGRARRVAGRAVRKLRSARSTR